MKANLSIVVITKNEERYIGLCLEGLLKEAADLGNTEIILVDSASGDKTVEIAAQYPVKIAVIDRKHKMTPGLGRLIGFELARADLIFFIDGDQVLNPGWLKEAILLLKSSGAIAGVTGNIEENGRVCEYFKGRYTNGIASAETMSGTALFKRGTIEKEGYDPYLRAFEDMDLFLRLQEKGLLIAWTGKIMSRHLDDTLRIGKDIKIMPWGFYSGLGQFLRRGIENKLFFSYVHSIKHPIRYLLWLAFGIFSLSLSFKTTINLFFIWLLVTVAGLAALFIKIKKVKQSFGSIWVMFLSTIGLVVGFFTLAKFEKNKKWEYKVIKE